MMTNVFNDSKKEMQKDITITNTTLHKHNKKKVDLFLEEINK